MYVPDEAETRRLPMTLVRHDSGGASAARLIDIVGPEMYFEPWGRGGVRQIFRLLGRDTGVAVGPRPSFTCPLRHSPGGRSRRLA